MSSTSQLRPNETIVYQGDVANQQSLMNIKQGRAGAAMPMKINTPHRLALWSLPVALLLAGCSNKPGDSDIQAALAAVYECPVLEVRDVKKLNGEPGAQGTYEVAVSYTVAIKGGQAGAQKLLTDWVFLTQEDRVAAKALHEAERQFGKDDSRVAALATYSKQTFEKWTKVIPCDGKELAAIVAPLYEQAEPVLLTGSGTAALPVGVQIVRPGVMSKSENGWYFRHLAPDFNSFEVLQGRPTAFALPPSKVPALVNAGAPTTGERTVTGVLNARLTDSCLAITVDGNEECYGLPADPEHAKRILSACGDGDRCTVTGQFDAKASSVLTVSKAVLAP